MRWPNGRRRLGHSHTTQLFMPCWATRFYEQDHRRLRSRSTSVQRRFPRRTRWAVTIWPGSSRPLLMLQFAMEIGQSSSRKRLSDSPAAKIPITSEPLPLRSLKLAISVRRKKLPGRLCKEPRGGATPLWPTRFRMKSHFMSSACRITSKASALKVKHLPRHAQERDVYSIMPSQPTKLRMSGMFERSRLILPTGKCNADRTEHGGAPEIRGILLETTFVDDASLGC